MNVIAHIKALFASLAESRRLIREAASMSTRRESREMQTLARLKEISASLKRIEEKWK